MEDHNGYGFYCDLEDYNQEAVGFKLTTYSTKISTHSTRIEPYKEVISPSFFILCMLREPKNFICIACSSFVGCILLHLYFS